MSSPALDALYARAALGMQLGLEPMQRACARAGHPERAFEIAHVGGTNGKGSVSAMVASMARAAGRKTGLYTSPHLCSFAERIRIDGEPIAATDLDVHLGAALDFGPDLSFFEVATLAALLAFARARVDLAVLEVGIGGRLDATNVVLPRCTAITSVGLDHQDRLGETIGEIAREKAGIAKRGVPLVVGELGAEARRVVNEEAASEGARVIDAAAPEGLSIGLAGAYQRRNARVAWTIAAELAIAEGARREGLRQVRWPGRFERIAPEGAIAGPFLLDGAHNPDGMRALVGAVQDSGSCPRAIVFGAVADKAWPSMLEILAPLGGHRIFAMPRGRAAASVADLVAAAGGGEGFVALPDALLRARQLAGDGTVLVCGSLYLVGQTRAVLLDLPEDPPVGL